jgi:hypothetical protein
MAQQHREERHAAAAGGEHDALGTVNPDELPHTADQQLLLEDQLNNPVNSSSCNDS